MGVKGRLLGRLGRKGGRAAEETVARALPPTPPQKAARSTWKLSRKKIAMGAAGGLGALAVAEKVRRGGPGMDKTGYTQSRGINMF